MVGIHQSKLTMVDVHPSFIWNTVVCAHLSASLHLTWVLLYRAWPAAMPSSDDLVLILSVFISFLENISVSQLWKANNCSQMSDQLIKHLEYDHSPVADGIKPEWSINDLRSFTVILGRYVLLACADGSRELKQRLCWQF